MEYIPLGIASYNPAMHQHAYNVIIIISRRAFLFSLFFAYAVNSDDRREDRGRTSAHIETGELMETKCTEHKYKKNDSIIGGMKTGRHRMVRYVSCVMFSFSHLNRLLVIRINEENT